MVMSRRWEEFALGPKDSGNGFHVTLNNKCEIMLGATASEKFGKSKWVKLLFDRRTFHIGIAPSATQVENSFPIVEKSKGRHRVIRAGRFCRYYNIRTPRTIALKADFDDDGTLVLDVTMTRTVARK